MLKLPFKVWRDGEQIAACAFAEDAAAIVALWNTAQIRHGNRIVWRDGEFGIRAEDSLDAVAQVIHERLEARRTK